MKNIIVSICWVVMLTATSTLAQQGSQPVAKVVFVKGAVLKETGNQAISLRLAQELVDSDLISVGNGGKLRLLMYKRKVLLTVLPVCKIRLKDAGVQLVDGSKDKITEQNVDFIYSTPDLGTSSRQIGGTSVTRGASSDVP